VRSGVAVGDIVVTAGQIRLRDGLPVNIANRGNAAPNDGPAPVIAGPDKDGRPAPAGEPAAKQKS
jgi:hypothetical protein